jgi:translin
VKTEEWESIVAELKPVMDARHAAREEVLKQSRLLIQISSKCIKHVHRRQLDEAAVLLAQARDVASGMRAFAEGHPEVIYAGYIQDSEKEMVEAAAVLSIVSGVALPTPGELGVGAKSYLNGMGEAASECRRYALDEMRAGSMANAEGLLKTMEVIYDELTTFDYPDSLTGGLRRTCDALRAVIERTRSDLTMTQVQLGLMNELKKAAEGD